MRGKDRRTGGKRRADQDTGRKDKRPSREECTKSLRLLQIYDRTIKRESERASRWCLILRSSSVGYLISIPTSNVTMFRGVEEGRDPAARRD